MPAHSKPPPSTPEPAAAGFDPRAARRFLREAFLGAQQDPYATLNVANARLMAGALWAIGVVLALLLLPVAPPTVALGPVGWAVAGGLIAAGALVAWRRLDPRRTTTPLQMLLAGYGGLIMAAGLEWLAGGRASPYHQLFVLPVLFAVAVHSRRRAVVFLLCLALAVMLPALYGRVGAEMISDMVTQVLMLAVLGALARLLVMIVRVQRGALNTALADAEGRARRDALTGLGNRRAFEETLEVEIARARRSGWSVAVILADVNDFKAVNDRSGHLVGDACLRLVADALLGCARQGDLCFRWGGDEFAMVLPQSDLATGQVVQGRVCATLAQALPPGPLSISCGAAELRTGQSSEGLVQAADQALLRAKDRRARGRDASPFALPARD